MKILVTGGLGHIGSRLIRYIARSPKVEMIIILDNLSTQRYCSLFNLPTEVEYKFLEGDIRRKTDLDAALKDVETVFHLAALTDAPSTLNMPELTKEINFEGTRNVVEACVRNGVKKIIYPSTTSVYGSCQGTVTEDWSNCNPQSPYAVYKMLGEQEVLGATRRGSIEGTVLRLGTIYGASIGMRFHTAVNKFAFQACMGLPITVWDKAYDQERPYLDLSDCVRAMEFMMTYEKGNGELYNVLTQNATVRQIVTAIKEFVPDLTVVFTNAPILNQTSYRVDDAKIKRTGFLLQGNLNDSVGETVSLLKSFLKADPSKTTTH